MPDVPFHGSLLALLLTVERIDFRQFSFSSLFRVSRQPERKEEKREAEGEKDERSKVVNQDVGEIR